MTSRLSPVLTEKDLPLAELFAARLDGELFAVDDSFAPIDEIEGPSHRALALAADEPARVIAERRSAAWVWGSVAAAPRPAQFCVAIGARIRASSAGWASVREVVIDSLEIASVSGMLVTIPLRTVTDLVRIEESFGAAEAEIVRDLMQRYDVSAAAVRGTMAGRRNLPGKRRALERLSQLS